MEPQWGGEKSLTAAEKDHTLTDRVCAFKTSWAECRDQKRCRHRANGGDFSLDIHSYRTFLAMDPGLITGFAMQLAFGSLHGDQNRHALDELRRRSDQRPLFLRHGKVHDQVCNR